MLKEQRLFYFFEPSRVKVLIKKKLTVDGKTWNEKRGAKKEK